MTREYINIENEEQWLKLRKQDITSTAMAALLNLSPYATPFEVYHAHKSDVQVPFDVSERMDKGRRMEAYVAQEIAIANGWEVKPLDIYARIPELKMAASFDFEYTKPCGTKGILEIKGVDYFRFKGTWELPEEEGEATPYIEIQLQHQFECADIYEEGVIVAATSIYDFHQYPRKRDREFGAGLRKAVAKFWEDVKNSNEPKPDFYKDGDVFAELYKDPNGEMEDKTNDVYFNDLLATHKIAAAEEKEAKERKAALKNEIFSILENSEGAFTNDYKVAAGWTKGSAGKVITQEMVGEITGNKKGHRQCLIKGIN